MCVCVMIMVTNFNDDYNDHHQKIESISLNANKNKQKNSKCPLTNEWINVVNKFCNFSIFFEESWYIYEKKHWGARKKVAKKKFHLRESEKVRERERETILHKIAINFFHLFSVPKEWIKHRKNEWTKNKMKKNSRLDTHTLSSEYFFLSKQ